MLISVIMKVENSAAIGILLIIQQHREGLSSGINCQVCAIYP